MVGLGRLLWSGWSALAALVEPTAAEIAAPLPGDDIVAVADIVMDRAFSVQAAVQDVWPWLVQLGKRRAGWYLPARLERLVPPSRRAIRRIEPRWQQLQAGDTIPDYGGPDASFQVALLTAPSTLVYRSRRGHTEVSWSINLRPDGAASRVHLRLRLAPVRHRVIASKLGGAFDLLTIAGLAAGIRERIPAA